MRPIVHDEAGSGPPVLLLHAGVADRRMWAAQREGLAEAYRVIGVDLRGFGDSPLPDEAYDHVDDVLDVLDRLDVERAAVVGSSFGGLVAQEVARRHPDRVGRLVLLCPASTLLEPDDELRELWTREHDLLEAGDLDGATELNVDAWCGPEADDEARSLVRLMQRRAFDLQTSAENLEVDEEPGDPAGIEAPTLVVSGGYDLAAFRSSARRLAATIPDAELLELPWAGHLPSLERPAEITALLRDHLARGVGIP